MKTKTKSSLRKEVKQSSAPPLAESSSNKLNWREAAFFVDIINPRVPRGAPVAMKDYLVACIEDSQMFFDYAATWDVSVSALKDKLRRMSSEEAESIADAIDRFWADPNRSVSRKGLAVYFNTGNSDRGARV